MRDWLDNTAWMLLLIVVSALIYIRAAPADPALWHVNPLTVPAPAGHGALARPGDGNIPVRAYPEPPEALLARLDAIIRQTPRTEVFAGSLADGHLTYVTRSLVFGFPDFASVSVLAQDGSAVPAIFSRPRFGSSDGGTNVARVSAWLAMLDQ